MRALTTRSRAGRRLAVAASDLRQRARHHRRGPLRGARRAHRRCGDGYKKAYGAPRPSTFAAQGAGTIFAANAPRCTPRPQRRAQATTTATRRARTPFPGPRSTTDHETADPTTPAQARSPVGPPSSARRAEPKLVNVPVTREARSSPTDRYNMFNACYGLQSTRTEPLAHRHTFPAFTASSLAAGSPAVLQADRARPLPALQQDSTFLDGGQPAAALRRPARPEQRLGRARRRVRPVPAARSPARAPSPTPPARPRVTGTGTPLRLQHAQWLR